MAGFLAFVILDASGRHQVSHTSVAQSTAHALVRGFGLGCVAVLFHFRIAWMGRDSAKTEFNRHVSGLVAALVKQRSHHCRNAGVPATSSTSVWKVSVTIDTVAAVPGGALKL